MEYHDKDSTTPDQALGWLLEISNNLRIADQRELTATIALDHFSVLTYGWRSSELCWIGVQDDKPVIVFGLDGDGCWMVGTPDIDRPPLSRQVARDTRKFMDLMNSVSPTIWNWIDMRNHKTLRWLLWSGFEVTDINIEHGLERRPFAKLSRTQR